MSSVKKIALCAVCIALCVVLPIAFHVFGPVASILSPMHIPVLLCGLVCGWPYGAFCGIAGPLLSHLINAMPPTAALIHMVPELCAYGLVCGLVMRFVRTGRTAVDLYCALVPAMLLGRMAGGVVRTLFLLGQGQGYTLAMWAAAYLLEALPGIILHLILVPALALVLMRAKLVPARYPRQAAQADPA